MVLETPCHTSCKTVLRKFFDVLVCPLYYQTLLYSTSTETTDGTSLDVHFEILFVQKLPYTLYMEKRSHQCGCSYVISHYLFSHFWKHTSHTHMVFLQCVFINAVLVYWRKEKYNCKIHTSVLSLLLYSLSSVRLKRWQINSKHIESYSANCSFYQTNSWKIWFYLQLKHTYYNKKSKNFQAFIKFVVFHKSPYLLWRHWIHFF